MGVTAMPEALVKVREEQERAAEKAKVWVRHALEELIASDDGYTERTAGEILALLDSDVGMPTEYARLVSTGFYQKRYDIVRNALHALADKKLVIIGETINSRGREGETFSRPRDVSADWVIEVDATDGMSKERALRGITAWFQLDGAVLNNVTGVFLTHKRRGKQDGKATAQVPGRGYDSRTVAGRPRRRKPRSTAGGD
jgi:hypothetical protein